MPKAFSAVFERKLKENSGENIHMFSKRLHYETHPGKMDFSHA